MLERLNQYLNKTIATYDLFDLDNAQISIKSILSQLGMTIFVIFIFTDLFPHPALKPGLIISFLNQTQQQLQEINSKITTRLSDSTNNR